MIIMMMIVIIMMSKEGIWMHEILLTYRHITIGIKHIPWDANNWGGKWHSLSQQEGKQTSKQVSELIRWSLIIRASSDNHYNMRSTTTRSEINKWITFLNFFLLISIESEKENCNKLHKTATPTQFECVNTNRILITRHLSLSLSPSLN